MTVTMVQAALLDKLHDGNEIKDFHFRLQNKANQIFDVECNAKCIKKENELVGYQMVIRDITERKRLEKELFDSSKMWKTPEPEPSLGLPNWRNIVMKLLVRIWNGFGNTP
jgi:hypothetical protein